MKNILLILSALLFYVHNNNGELLDLSQFRCGAEQELYAEYTIWLRLNVLADTTNSEVKQVTGSSLVESVVNWLDMKAMTNDSVWNSSWCFSTVAMKKRENKAMVPCRRRLIGETDEEYFTRRRLCTRRLSSASFPGPQYQIIYGVNEAFDRDVDIFYLFNQSDGFLEDFRDYSYLNGLEAGIVNETSDVPVQSISIGSKGFILDTANYFCNTSADPADTAYTFWFTIITSAADDTVVNELFETALITTIRKEEKRWDPDWCLERQDFNRYDFDDMVACVRRLINEDAETRRRLCTRRRLVDDNGYLDSGDDDYADSVQFAITVGVNADLNYDVLMDILDDNVNASVAFLGQLRTNFIDIASDFNNNQSIIDSGSAVSMVTVGDDHGDSGEETSTTEEGGESGDDANLASLLFAVIISIVLVLLN